MRPLLAAILGAVVALSACAPDRRKCTTGAQCHLANGGNGLCIDSSCAYDDPSCASGLRFDEHAEEPNHCIPKADSGLPDDAPEADAADDATLADAPADAGVDGGDGG